MNKFSFVVTSSFLNLTNTETGNSFTINKDDSRFNKAVEMLKEKAYEALEKFLDVKVVVQEFVSKAVITNTGITVTLENGVVYYSYKGGAKTPLHGALVNRIIDQAKAGFDVAPLCRFMENLLQNPSKTAIDELYLFLESCKLPITEDGCFIAYKIVKNDYMDIYTGKTCRHMIGDKPEMPRFEVDENRSNTCSRGLHFCSKEYLRHYGSNNKTTDRAVLLKINPADVVSIPSDYNNAKGRAWRYEVVGEVPAGWRETLPKADYTDAPIVDVDGCDFIDDDYDEYDHEEGIDTDPFFFNLSTNRWHDGRTNAMVSRRVVANYLGISTDDVEELEI